MTTKTYVLDDITEKIDNDAKPFEVLFGNETYKLDLGEVSASAVTSWLKNHDVKPLAKLLAQDGSKPKAKVKGTSDWAEARAYAKASGIPVKDRGNPGKAVLDAYHKRVI